MQENAEKCLPNLHLLSRGYCLGSTLELPHLYKSNRSHANINSLINLKYPFAKKYKYSLPIAANQFVKDCKSKSVKTLLALIC